MIYLKAKDNKGYLVYNSSTKKITIINTKEGTSRTMGINILDIATILIDVKHKFEVVEGLPKAVKVLYVPKV